MNNINTIQKVYNLKSFEDAAAKAKGFKDAGGIILARNLEHVSPEIFTQQYPDLTFMQQGITVNNEGGWATSITKLKLAVQGAFKQSGSNTQTTGKITMGGESDTLRVISREAESDWSENELREADLQNINLASRFVEGHAQVFNQELDEIGYMGTNGSNGLLTASRTNTTTAGTASSLSGLELYEAIATLIREQWSGVRNTAAFKADRVVFPDNVYNLLFSKFMTSEIDSTSTVPQESPLDPIVATLNATILASADSVMAALVKNFPTVSFGMTDKARTPQGGTGETGSYTVAFSSNRAGMQFRLPVPLMISPVAQLGHKYYMESMYRVAGLDIIEDKAARGLRGL